MTWAAKGKPLTVDEDASIAEADPEPTDAELEHASENERRMDPLLRAKLADIDGQVDGIEASAIAASEGKGLEPYHKTAVELSPQERRRLRAKQVKIDAQLRDAGVKDFKDFDPSQPRDRQGRWTGGFHYTSAERAMELLKHGVRADKLGGGNYGLGFYTSQFPQGADDAYGPVGLRVKIKLSNPLVLDRKGSAVLKRVNEEVRAELEAEGISAFGREWDKRVTAKLQALGYDGVIVPSTDRESGGTYQIVFDPTKVAIEGIHARGRRQP